MTPEAEVRGGPDRERDYPKGGPDRDNPKGGHDRDNPKTSFGHDAVDPNVRDLKDDEKDERIGISQLMATPEQTTYPDTLPPGVAGMPASTTGWDADSKIVETAAGIGFGLAVSQGAGERGVILGGTTAGFRGVTYKDITLVHDAANLDKYVRYENCGVMIRGDIWVTVAAAVTLASAVIFDAATGQFGAATGQTITNARYLKAQATPGGLTILRVSAF
jgi:hypothetical protein